MLWSALPAKRETNIDQIHDHVGALAYYAHVEYKIVSVVGIRACVRVQFIVDKILNIKLEKDSNIVLKYILRL